MKDPFLFLGASRRSDPRKVSDLHGAENLGILKVEAVNTHTSHFHTIQSGAGASASSNLVATAKVLVLSEEIGPARGTRMIGHSRRAALPSCVEGFLVLLSRTLHPAAQRKRESNERIKRRNHRSARPGLHSY
jgi:hypothetical protein